MTATPSAHEPTPTAPRPRKTLPDIAFPWVLSPRLWLGTLFLWALLSWLFPALYRAMSPPPDITQRAPFAASDDYWVFRSRAAETAAQGHIALLGDSVIWGQYVADPDTLSSALNRIEGRDRFVNLGVNGLHPAAMRGLIHYHGRALSNSRIVVFCNLLWMSSPRHDLTAEDPASFNHPGLIPQYRPRLPIYDAGSDQRISRVLTRYLPPMIWAQHLRIRYLENQDFFRWMIDNPRALPSFKPLEEPVLAPGVRPVPWRQGGLRAGPMDLVDPDDSFQWAAFLDTVDLLASRGNEVMVVLLPFNEHMLTEPGLSRYRAFTETAKETLQARTIPVVSMSVLESDDYGDASHPLAKGYEDMAWALMRNPAFSRFVSGTWMEAQAGPVCFSSQCVPLD